jgi:CxxC motif-containing protein
MKEELTCITCPMGCRLEAERALDGSLSVSGNRCPRGAAYAREELLSPKRVVTATCRIAERSIAGEGTTRAFALSVAGQGIRRIPCKTAAPFPKERVPELLAQIYRIEVELPVDRGQVLLADALGSGIDVVATRSVV